jgi:Mg/Co/Ni transporter MgtE
MKMLSGMEVFYLLMILNLLMIAILQAIKELKEFVPESDMVELEFLGDWNREYYEISIHTTVMATLLEITEGKVPNRLMEMLNMEKIKKWAEECPQDDTVILISHWSINRPAYTEQEALDGLPEQDQEEVEEELGYPLFVTQFDDLVMDPHGRLLD